MKCALAVFRYEAAKSSTYVANRMVGGRKPPMLRPDALYEVDQALRELLREWRRATARSQSLPAFAVMHDTSLEELCRVKPKSLEELRHT
jgi:ATP-dependent DNA helicase RecQ